MQIKDHTAHSVQPDLDLFCMQTQSCCTEQLADYLCTTLQTKNKIEFKRCEFSKKKKLS